ncbi:MAG: class I SAM-dependent methyltransferase, partial [Bryobacteraceae bacterium]
YDVSAVDRDLESIAYVRGLAASLAPNLSSQNFRAESIESMSFAHSFADFVISSAVLHFAQDDNQFKDMLHGTWRVLKPGGLLFCRLASSIGLENQIRRVSGRRYLLPDGSERYLVDEALLTQAAKNLGGQMIDPLKTTVVQNERSMTTWILQKIKSGRIDI